MENQHKIPKIIHCCWLSGDPLPELYQKCMDSWKKHMPEYEIRVWDKNRFPIEEVRFVKQAYEAKKWAYAADYIRLYALYHHGGIYLDMDVMVYRSLNPFLIHEAFSSIEFDPRLFYPSMKKKEVLGIAIEAAVLGSRKGHPWLLDIMDFYKDKEFRNDPKYCWSIVMPRIIRQVLMEKYGFRLVPIYQVLKDDIHIYPSDVFSSCYDLSIIGLEKDLNRDFSVLKNDNQIRYTYHICAHGWVEKGNEDTTGVIYNLKKMLLTLLGKNVIDYFKRIFGLRKLW